MGDTLVLLIFNLDCDCNAKHDLYDICYYIDYMGIFYFGKNLLKGIGEELASL